MKKGYLGPFQLGTLQEAIEILKFAEALSLETAEDIEKIFYMSAFQAGVDEFILSSPSDRKGISSEFVSSRTTFIDEETFEEHSRLVDNAFSMYLPDDWQRNADYHGVWKVTSFITEALEAMSKRASLLLPSGIPDMSEVESQLPSELFVPVFNLISSISDLQTPSPIPKKLVAVDDFQRLNQIICGDSFNQYSISQTALEDSDTSLETTMSRVIASGKELFYGTNNYWLLGKLV